MGLFKQNDFKNAEEVFLELVKDRPTLFSMYPFLIKCLYENGNYDRAVFYLEILENNGSRTINQLIDNEIYSSILYTKGEHKKSLKYAKIGLETSKNIDELAQLKLLSCLNRLALHVFPNGKKVITQKKNWRKYPKLQYYLIRFYDINDEVETRIRELSFDNADCEMERTAILREKIIEYLESMDAKLSSLEKQLKNEKKGIIKGKERTSIFAIGEMIHSEIKLHIKKEKIFHLIAIGNVKEGERLFEEFRSSYPGEDIAVAKVHIDKIKKAKSVMVLFWIIIIVVLAGGGWALYFFLSRKLIAVTSDQRPATGKEQKEEDKTEEKAEESTEEEKEEKKKETKKKEKKDKKKKSKKKAKESEKDEDEDEQSSSGTSDKEQGTSVFDISSAETSDQRTATGEEQKGEDKTEEKAEKSTESEKEEKKKETKKKEKKDKKKRSKKKAKESEKDEEKKEEKSEAEKKSEEKDFKIEFPTEHEDEQSSSGTSDTLRSGPSEPVDPVEQQTREDEEGSEDEIRDTGHETEEEETESRDKEVESSEEESEVEKPEESTEEEPGSEAPSTDEPKTEDQIVYDSMNDLADDLLSISDEDLANVNKEIKKSEDFKEIEETKAKREEERKTEAAKEEPVSEDADISKEEVIDRYFNILAEGDHGKEKKFVKKYKKDDELMSIMKILHYFKNGQITKILEEFKTLDIIENMSWMQKIIYEIEHTGVDTAEKMMLLFFFYEGIGNRDKGEFYKTTLYNLWKKKKK